MQMNLKLDWSLFAYDTENGLLELYYSFSQEDLVYQKLGETYVGYAIGNLNLFHSDTLYEKYFWKNHGQLYF